MVSSELLGVSAMVLHPLDAWRSRGSREGKRTHPLLHLARDDKERASSIDELKIDGALGIALFFSPFLSSTAGLYLNENAVSFSGA
ncbi:hypothetical protein YC2023_058697 [Brassica napus]|uniref:(rape) hypothetical protein n=1 Tax=Brassica napus TaxID=3708 RepID=A0A816KX86_BRANA|nr:unnamed protein product [Brassica napus]